MTDADGYEATQAEFYQPRPSSWIEVRGMSEGWMYQKVADGQLQPLFIMTTARVGAVTYQQYVERADKRPYSQVIDGYRQMAQQKAVAE